MQESDASSETSEGLSREELGRLVASRWTGESTENQGGTKDNNADDTHEEMPKDTHDEQYDGYASDTDEDTGKYDDSGKYDDDNDDIDDELDASYEEENHDDSTSYKSDVDDETDFSGLQLFSSQYFILSWANAIPKLTVKYAVRYNFHR